MGPYTNTLFTRNGLSKENPFPGKKIVHVGCGSNKLPGAVGVDVLPIPGVDVVHDLDVYPWPFADSTVDIVYAHSVIEHVTDVVACMDEVWRILKPGGRCIILVPYFRSTDSFTDITHKHFFTSQSFNYFFDESTSHAQYQYTQRRWSQVGFWFGWPLVSSNPLIRIFKKIIHRFPRAYDSHLSLILPVKNLVWEMEPKKAT